MNFSLPFKDDISYTITQTFDQHELRRKENNWMYYNGGIDYYFYAMPEGTEIRPSEEGAVIAVDTDTAKGGGYGRYVKTRHSNGFITLYAHLSNQCVKVGDYVSKDRVIGYSGSTGNSTGPHLHFEMRNQNNVPVNPELYFGIPVSIPTIPEVSDALYSKVIEGGVRARLEPKIDPKNVIFSPSVGMKLKKSGGIIKSEGYEWQAHLFYVAMKSKDGSVHYLG